MLRGTLERVPRTPRTFLKFFIGGGGVAVPKGGLPPAGGVPLRGTCSPCRCGALWGGAVVLVARRCGKLNGGLAFFVACLPCRCRTRRGLNPGGTCYPSPGGEDHLKRRSSSPPVPPLLGCRHCSPVPRPNRNAPAGCRQRRGKAPLRAPAWQGYKCRVGSGVEMQGAEPLA